MLLYLLCSNWNFVSALFLTNCVDSPWPSMWLSSSYGYQADQILDNKKSHVKVMGPL